MKSPTAWKKQLAAFIIVAVFAIYQYYQKEQAGITPGDQHGDSSSDVSQIKNWRSGQWVQLDATVNRVLQDDTEGSRHQRFIIKLNNRQTLLVAHNIDLAKRIPVHKGDSVSLRGRFEPNNRGGVVCLGST